MSSITNSATFAASIAELVIWGDMGCYFVRGDILFQAKSCIVLLSILKNVSVYKALLRLLEGHKIDRHCHHICEVVKRRLFVAYPKAID